MSDETEDQTMSEGLSLAIAFDQRETDKVSDRRLGGKAFQKE
jgi:hypothetical protein